MRIAAGRALAVAFAMLSLLWPGYGLIDLSVRSNPA
jgi:hypothetical protein